jgi:uncharacterized protein
MKIYILLLLLIIPLATALDIPSYTSYVNDYADVISSEDEVRINALIEQIEKNTTTELAILTINSLEDETKESFAFTVAEAWGVGKENQDNGLLLLIAVEDREYRFEVGYGLEGVLNDAKIGRIGRNILVPELQNNNYGTGIYQSILSIEQELETPTTTSKEQTGIIIFVYAFALLFIGALLAGIKAPTKRRTTSILIGSIAVLTSFFLKPILISLAVFLLALLSIYLAWKYMPPQQGNSRRLGGPGYMGGGRGGFGGFGGGSFGGGGAGGKF